MKTTIEIENQKLKLNLGKGFDISCPLRKGKNNIHAWYVPDVSIEPVMENGWIGSTKLGGNVNFRNISFNPHGHGTHTETAEHILKKIKTSFENNAMTIKEESFSILVSKIKKKENIINPEITNAIISCFK